MEKNLKKNIYIYLLSHFAVHLKLTQYYKSTILQFLKTQISTDGQKAHEKMLSIIMREMQIKTISIQWGITSHWSEWLGSKNLQTANAGEGVEKREPFCTIGGNVNWCTHYGEQYGGSLKN